MRRRAADFAAAILLLAAMIDPIAAEPVRARVAVAAPVAGPRAAMGQSIHAAAAMVAADIAALGRVALDIVAVEDTCSSADAARAAEALSAAQFDAVIGLPCRASSDMAAVVFSRTGQILLATAPLVPPLSPIRSGPTVFRLPVAHHSLGHYLGDQLAAAPAEAKLAVIRDKTRQAVELAAAVDTAVRAAGRSIAMTEIFTGGDKAFGVLVARLKAQGVARVALLAFPVEGGLIARELAAAIPEIEIFGPDFLAAPETALIAAEGAARLRLVLPAEAPLGRSPETEAFAGRLSAQSMVPTREAFAVATALELYADALHRVGSPEPSALAPALSAPIRTRFGVHAFDARGHSVVPYWAVHVWRDGRWTETPQR